jgi:hypothetical protein
MSSFRNQLNFDFSGITFQDKKLSKQEKTENKMLKKIQKHNFKFKNKIENDCDVIRNLVSNIEPDEILNLISKEFDSPNIVLSFVKKIERLFIATWAITPAGINALVKITGNGIINECWMILDKTHSYKWIFQSEAYKILRGKVKVKFCTNHSKFICFQLSTGEYFNFVGSMNFSRNPRFENITVDRLKENFEFYSQFIKQVAGEIL